MNMNTNKPKGSQYMSNYTAKIITRAGTVNSNDVIACALVLVDRTWNYQEMTMQEDGRDHTLSVALDTACERVVIERRGPTEAELADKRTLVLGVGGIYDPEHNNFDTGSDTRESAMSLFAANIGIPCGAFDCTTAYKPGSAEYPTDSLMSFIEHQVHTRLSEFFKQHEDILGAFKNATPENRVLVVKPLAELILREHKAWTTKIAWI